MIPLLVLQAALLTAQNGRNELPVNSVNAITVAAAPETEALTEFWIEGFRLANPSAEVNLVTAENSSTADIRIITGNSPEFRNETAGWKIVVGRDVIVPVMSQADPFRASLPGYGISPEKFAMILSSDGSITWGKCLGTGSSTPVTALIPDDKAVLPALAAFAETQPELVTASRVSNTALLAALLQGKPGTIAFCRLADITDETGRNFIAGIEIIPIDVNNNAKSDYFEQFYADYNSFSRGVYIGKYPKTLCNNIYAASDVVPAGGAPSDFIGYILADGQRSLAGTGFTALSTGEGNIKREALASARSAIMAGSEGRPSFRAWLWIMAVIVSVSLVAYLVYLFTRSGVKETIVPVTEPQEAFSLRSLTAPAGILYDKNHAWSFMEKDGTVRVGIDDFLQHVTGAITRVVMKFPGEKVRKGEYVMSIIQHGKKLDIQSPVSGTIVARNERLNSDTGILHSSPYDNGWIYSIEPENWEKESRFMIMAGGYLEYLKEEFVRMRDFLAVMPGVNDVRYANVVMQDGGEFKDGLLGELGPEVWEEFQNRFLDSPR